MFAWLVWIVDFVAVGVGFDWCWVLVWDVVSWGLGVLDDLLQYFLLWELLGTWYFPGFSCLLC